MKKIFIGFMVLLLLSACAQRKVIVDSRGINMVRYQADLAECQNYADQVQSKTGKGIVAGAIIGGAVGAIVGNHKTAEKLAGVGAVSGGVKGAVGTRREKTMVVRRCLRGRGYTVLN